MPNKPPAIESVAPENVDLAEDDLAKRRTSLEWVDIERNLGFLATDEFVQLTIDDIPKDDREIPATTS